MKFEKPDAVSLIGLVLSIVGLYLFLGLDTSPVLIPSRIQVLPIIGGVILGIGFALMFFKRNLTTTLTGFVVFLAMSVINIVSLGFALGMLIPGLTGKGKTLPVYAAAGILLISTVMVVSNNPSLYQENIVDQMVNITYKNMGSIQESTRSMLEQEVNAMIPTRTQIDQMMAEMLPCDNQTYQQQCLQVRNELASQMYKQTHSPEYKNEIMNRLPKVEVNKSQIASMIAKMPIMQAILKNIQYVIAIITTGWFLLYSLAITIPQSILDFFIGFIPRKEKKEKNNQEAPKQEKKETDKVW